MIKPSPGRDDRAAQAGSKNQAPVIAPDDLEFEIELDFDSDDDLVSTVGQSSAGGASEDEPAADRPSGGSPDRVRAEPGRVAHPPVAPLPPPPIAPARVSAPARPAKPAQARSAEDESGGRYAIATRGGESTVVAPRRPVVVPRNR